MSNPPFNLPVIVISCSIPWCQLGVSASFPTWPSMSRCGTRLPTRSAYSPDIISLVLLFGRNVCPLQKVCYIQKNSGTEKEEHFKLTQKEDKTQLSTLMVVKHISNLHKGKKNINGCKTHFKLRRREKKTLMVVKHISK